MGRNGHRHLQRQQRRRLRRRLRDHYRHPVTAIPIINQAHMGGPSRASFSSPRSVMGGRVGVGSVVLSVDEDVSDDLAVAESVEADDGVSIRVASAYDFDQSRDV